MSASLKQNLSPPSAPKPEGRKIKSNIFRSTEDHERALSEKLPTPERPNSPLMSLHNYSIPDEIIATLVTTVSPLERLGPPKLTKTPKELKVHGMRSIDAVWRHPVGRNKYKYILDQPTSLSGAGRDLSYLCDAVVARRKLDLLPPVKEKSNICNEVNVMETLIPEEYHIVKSKGVMGLEHYEDEYTVLLEDEEKRLRVFPSLRPSGRLEAVQLMKVMDEMLDKAGVNQEHPQLTDLSQMQGLLELVRVEQNIYNIIFHEVIRQVSVQCVERGQLLSKLRQRYAALLDRIPRQLKGLHTTVLAQKALGRRLTEEIIHFKTSMLQLNSELSEMRKHDDRVSVEAGRTQEELSKALEQSQRNSDLVREYHGLYEMQRKRLEDQLAQVTEEKDTWSKVAYRLALKVIKANNLQVASRLHVSKQMWTKIVEHFTTLLTSKDKEDMNRILQLTDQWQEQARSFMQKLRETECNQCEKIRTVTAGMLKWQELCQANVNDPDKMFDKETEGSFLADIKHWSALLTMQCERYGGEQLLSFQEALHSLSQLQRAWVEVGLELFTRHPGPEGEVPTGQNAMQELSETISDLHEQLSTRITGENGIYRLLMSLAGMMDRWATQMRGVRTQAEDLAHRDWLKLEKSLSSWIKLTEEAVECVSSTEPEDKRINLKSHIRIDIDDVFTMLRKFLFTQDNFVECENRRLYDEASSLHARMTRWMVDVLHLMVPNCCDDHRSLDTDLEARLLSLLTLEEDGTYLVQKLEIFSKYLTNSCQAIEEEIIQKATMQDENEMFELSNLQRECGEWVDICRILLTNMKIQSLNAQVAESTDLGESVTAEPIEASTVDQHTKMPSVTKEWKEATGEESVESPETDQGSREALCVLKAIGHDGNIIEKTLGADTVPLTGTGEMVTRPQTASTQRAFDGLATLGVLQQQLLAAEQRAQGAEERALRSEESLKMALLRIHELERQLHCGVTVEDMSATVSNVGSPKPSEPKTGN